MRSITRLSLVVATALTLLLPLGAQDSFAEFEKKVTEFTLDNGMKFLIVERHNAPVVSFYTYADVGSVQEVKTAATGHRRAGHDAP